MTNIGGKSAAIDTNILLLLIVGRFDRASISRIRSTRHFSVADYDLLESFTARFQQVVTTPQVLTETSNLIGRDFHRRQWLKIFDVLASMINGLTEVSVPSVSLSAHRYFNQLGLADVSLLLLKDTLVLTDDFRLMNFMYSQGREVINFVKLRQGE